MRISDWSSDVCSSDLFGDGSFSLTGWDFETMVRFGLPFIGVIGNNSHMNQIRYGQIMKYGAERGEVGNKLGDVHYSKFAEMLRSEEHTSELQSLMRISYAVFCLQKKTIKNNNK